MAPAGKQLRNRMPKQTCLQRCAGVRARDANSGYGQPKGGQHHRQPDDLRARFKVPEWGAFCHTARLRNRPPRLKLVLSDSAHRIDPNFGQAPHNIHDMEIVYYQNGDYEWGQYMAEQVNKHPHDVKGRLLGYSSNLSLVLK